MKIAVTGATGFLGRYVVRQLASDGHILRCWHRDCSDRTGFAPAEPAIEWVPGDLTDEGSVAPLLRGAEAVVHAALARDALTSFRASGGRDLLGFVEANLIGSLRLMQAARAAGVGRFIFISTCAVHEVVLEDRPLDEDHPPRPTTAYGAHKAALEMFVHSYGLGEGWPICSLRPCGIYGLAHPPAASKWYELTGRVLRGEPVASPRGGKEVHAHDVARAVALLLRVPAQSLAGQAFNCCDRYVSDQQLARLAKELTSSPSVIEDLNRGPRHQIVTAKLRALGFEFGGESLLRQTVAELIAAHRA